MNKLYTILVPTRWGDRPEIPIRKKHHKEWDKRIIKIAGGLTILSSGLGKWNFQGTTFNEKVIPVMVMCNEKDIRKIIDITISHYKQKAVMYYCVTQEVEVVYAD
mgnify:CR=1 FL=1